MSAKRTDGGETTQSAVETELDRDIGIVGAVALGVGTMIAAGIFVLSGLAVSNVGAMAIVSFLVAAVVASFTAFAYAEFASIYPESGGGYAYVANTFDSDLSYIVGWSMILGYPASAAFYLASFSDWFFEFIYPALDVSRAIPFWVSGVLVLLLLIGVNLKGTEETGLFQIVVTGLKVLLIVIFLAGGLTAFQTGVVAGSFADNLDNVAQIGLTSALVFITFFGFEAIATNAEEIEDPGETVPRAIFVSMGLVTVVYALVVTVIVLAVNNGEFLAFLAEQVGIPQSQATSYIAGHGEVSMAYAAQHYLGGAGFYVIIVGALFSMLSAANATILAGSRVKLAMSRRDHLPRQFEDLHDSLNTPWASVLFTGTLILLFIGLFSVLLRASGEGAHHAKSAFETFFPALASGEGGSSRPLVEAVTQPQLGISAIAHFADFMLLTGLIAVNVAVVRSRRTNQDLDRRFTVPLVPWVPIVAVLANLVLVGNIPLDIVVFGLVAEVVGVGFWFGWRTLRSESAVAEREAPTVVHERHEPERDYQLLVPVANPAHVDQLMNTATDVAAANDGEVIAMTVARLPEQTPLSEGRDLAEERSEVTRRAMAAVDSDEVPVSGVVRVGHHVDAAILHTIDQFDVDAVLLGWKGRRKRRRDHVLGSTVDEVVVEAPCDVLVERVGPASDETVESVLLPTAGGPHAEYAASVARAVAVANDATVEVLHVRTDEESRGSAESSIEVTAEGLDGVAVETQVVDSNDVVGTIVDRSGDHDCTVIGATREGLLQQFVFGSIPEAVGERAAGAVIMAKRGLGLQSRLQTLLGQRER
ncbi:amino acid permease [Haloarchaeobius sp. HRN-SO-5]|uniref:amino acid permease n=1 Tax=Haloarchaeobius sp. HRN-SO-5 TaxID=3446118 RepID=UPI003EBCAEF4